MKKILISILALTIAMTTVSFATPITLKTTERPGAANGVQIVVSPGVALGYASGSLTTYVILGTNTKGTMLYGMQQDDANVYQKEANAIPETVELDTDFLILGGSGNYSAN